MAELIPKIEEHTRRYRNFSIIFLLSLFLLGLSFGVILGNFGAMIFAWIGASYFVGNVIGFAEVLDFMKEQQKVK